VPRVVFTSHLERHLSAPPREVEGATVREILDRVFALNPRLESYVVDDQGRLREHVTVFIDEKPVEDRDGLSDPVGDDAEIYVLQALSGG
jgi:sulfur-carrier protein